VLVDFPATAQWPTWLALVLLLVVVGLVLAIWSIRRHRDPKLEIDCDTPIDQLLPSLSGLTQGTVYEGNWVELLEDGDFLEAMFEEIRGATSSVHFETFLWKDGVLGRRLADSLIERGRAGVPVRVLVDADGGKKMGADSARRLREAGCHLEWHHPRHVRHIGVFNERDHRNWR
jgi:cardiolipin synthase